jgi:hypothetical protein
MQTLRDLRAVSLGRSPGRRPPPSMPEASTWKSASPLPNLPRPTSAVGSRAEGSDSRHDRCPAVEAGPPGAPRLRAARIARPAGARGRCGADPRRGGRPWRTACGLVHDPARQEAGDRGPSRRQARTLEAQRAYSDRASLRPRRQPSGGRAGAGGTEGVAVRASRGSVVLGADGLRGRVPPRGPAVGEGGWRATISR